MAGGVSCQILWKHQKTPHKLYYPYPVLETSGPELDLVLLFQIGQPFKPVFSRNWNTHFPKIFHHCFALHSISLLATGMTNMGHILMDSC